jgi:hypothetical protein
VVSPDYSLMSASKLTYLRITKKRRNYFRRSFKNSVKKSGIGLRKQETAHAIAIAKTWRRVKKKRRTRRMKLYPWIFRRFAAVILGLAAVLKNEQIGTLLAAIAGYVLGKANSRNQSAPTGAPTQDGGKK